MSIKPRREHVEFDVLKAWFLSRARGEIGELILNEKYLMVTFRFKGDEEVRGKVAWDCNEKSLDGFSPGIGWIRMDLAKLFHIHRVYEVRRRVQRRTSKKSSLSLVKYLSVGRIGLRISFIS